jgi:hypothetical protein
VESESSEDGVRRRGIKTGDNHFFRRFKSERELEEILDWELESGAAYHVISGGDIDSLSFLKFVLRQWPLEYCLLSTWCMALQDVEELGRYLRLGRIKRLDCYVGEIFKGSYRNEWDRLCEIMREYNGRVCVFRNHSKIYAGFSGETGIVIESSANINTNPRTENTVITVNYQLARFYKDFFDGIKSFDREFDNWAKYEIGG